MRNDYLRRLMNLAHMPSNASTRLPSRAANGVFNVYAYGPIMAEAGEWDYAPATYISVVWMSAELAKATTGAPVVIHLNTAGGDVFEAEAIRALVASSELDISWQIEGSALSCGSWLPTASGRKVSATRGSLLMIHAATSYGWGNSADFRATADMLEQTDTAIASHYADRLKMSNEEVVALMQAETWFTAQKALDAGLIDAITDGPALSAELVTNMQAAGVFNRAPRELVDAITSAVRNEAKALADAQAVERAAFLARLEGVTL